MAGGANPGDNILADVYDCWLPTLPLMQQWIARSDLLKLLDIPKMGEISAKALLVKIYVFAGAHPELIGVQHEIHGYGN